jgi:hypothetical protein
MTRHCSCPATFRLAVAQRLLVGVEWADDTMNADEAEYDYEPACSYVGSPV